MKSRTPKQKDGARVYLDAITSYHPDGVLTNAKFEEKLETTSAWIQEHVGIEERRFLNDYTGPYPVFEMARRVVEKIAQENPVKFKKIDFIISCSTLDDLHFPTPASMISEILGLSVPAMHLKNACSSLVYGIATARAFVQSGQYDNILLICAEPFTRQVDYGDRKSCILFGDASAACIVSSEIGVFEIVDVALGGKGQQIVASNRTSPTSHLSVWDFASEDALKSGLPPVNRRRSGDNKFEQDGKEVSKFFENILPGEVEGFLERNSLSLNDIDNVVLHQANLRLMEKVLEKIGINKEKNITNIKDYGNTSSSGWMTAIASALDKNKFKPNGRLLAAVFGAGMTWGEILLKKI